MNEQREALALWFHDRTCHDPKCDKALDEFDYEDADELLDSPALARLLAEARAEGEIAGQMRHISAEVARGDVPLSDTEEMIADLRARLSHVEAERDEARGEGLRARPRGVANSIVNAERDGYRRGRAETAAAVEGVAETIANAAAEPVENFTINGWRQLLYMAAHDVRAALTPVAAQDPA